MKSSAAVLMFTLLLITQDAHGLFEDPRCERCKCQKTTKSFVHPKKISDIRLLLPTHCCPRKEMILTLKTGSLVCVDPAAKWINTLLKIIQENKKESENPSL
ncbi:C-X-C motif chemokine 13 [Microcaecilia unicolor]|uniref:C-X-C motif chemokine 13 n=1 Tax=Microcaecilia unicolor TaxID=1415580 RepID=A0A6P7WZ46_9AMPH|nr:C-X-C motif chemokine 13 [Microcaecilia unicolor]